MCRVTAPLLKNLVLHFKVLPEERERLSQVGLRTGRYDASRRNFYVLKLARHSTAKSWSGGVRQRRHVVSFTVFPSSGSVIATGVRSSSDVLSALSLFSSLTDLKRPSAWSRKVVNSTYVGSVTCGDSPVSTHRSLARYKESGEKAEEVNISFRPQFFPGGLIRWRATPGSVNLFNNGKYVVVGVRTESEARWLGRRLCALIRTHWTTTKSRTSCAWTAV